jgi:TetR/AcrR family transcriptional regulator
MAMTAKPKQINDKERNPQRTREAILDAAEEVFAEQGYASTSLQVIGTRAGVSRGTPGYFFGSKPDLYQAVLERCFGRARAAIRSGRDRALASQETPEVVLAGAVAEYFEFFVSNQNFVRLMEREALSGGPKPEGFSPRSNVVSEATAAISEELGLDPSQGAEAAHLVLSIMGLCWFPTVHAGTVLPALGFDPRSPEFHEQRKRHVVELVLRGVQGNIPLTNLSSP